MDEPHLVNSNFREEFKNFCNQFFSDRVEQKWIFFERNVVACINNVFHDWQKGTKEVSRLQSLANQLDEYQVPSLRTFPGHEKVEPIKVCGEKPRFTEEEAAICWLYKTMFEEIVVKK